MRLLVRDLTSPSTAERQKVSRFDVYEGFGNPEGVETGKVGDLFINKQGDQTNSMYLKVSGHQTTTGWQPVHAYSGWNDEQIFTATQGQTIFDVSSYTFTATDKLTVYINGVEQEEGGGFHYVRNASLNRITLNSGVTVNALVKIRKW